MQDIPPIGSLSHSITTTYTFPFPFSHLTSCVKSISRRGLVQVLLSVIWLIPSSTLHSLPYHRYFINLDVFMSLFGRIIRGPRVTKVLTVTGVALLFSIWLHWHLRHPLKARRSWWNHLFASDWGFLDFCLFTSGVLFRSLLLLVLLRTVWSSLPKRLPGRRPTWRVPVGLN